MCCTEAGGYYASWVTWTLDVLSLKKLHVSATERLICLTQTVMRVLFHRTHLHKATVITYVYQSIFLRPKYCLGAAVLKVASTLAW